MKPFEIAEAFREQHGRRMSLPELKKLFERSLQEMGIRQFACCTHGDPLSARNAPLVFHTYPQDWVRTFSENGYYRIDPVFRYADERMIPFSWDDVEFRASLTNAQRGILLEAQRHGIVHGYTVPIRPPGAQMASCSVVPDSGAIEPGAHQALFSMAWLMFDAMLQSSIRTECNGIPRPSVQLSERERQCLQLAAQGKDDWSIGSLLRISERTAHNHIERAKRRLGVCTRVQVIVHALSDGQISFGDVIKAETSRNA